jgi:hypothetical protein
MAAESEPRLVALPLRPAVFVDAGIAWKAGAYVSRAARAFLEFVIASDFPGAKALPSTRPAIAR